MTRRYEEILGRLRQAFPQPVSDPVHDAYFVYSISRALDQIDNLKSQAPILGSSVQADYSAARRTVVAEQGESLEQVIPQLVKTLEGMFIWGHPACQVNVVPPPSIASIIGVLLPSTYNPNLCSEEGAQRPAETEVRVVSMASELIGFDPQEADGVFTFGGTGAMLYGVKIGLEKALPGTSRTGVQGKVVLLSSEQSHYSCLNVASWLGIGQDQVVRIPTTEDNAIRLELLEAAARQALDEGCRIAAMIATLGTTDAFGLDNLAAMVELRDRLVEEYQLDYRPHVHADAVIGWAWSVFRDYDFKQNPLGFRGRTVRALAAADYRVRHLGQADSVGIDFHKTGFAPYVSSLVLVRDRKDLERISRGRDAMPYLYHTGKRNPGIFTLETTRSGVGPLAALANLLLLGREGIRTLLGHVVDMAETLRERLESHPDLTVVNGENVGPVTLFRVYPHGTDTFTVKKREQCDPKYRAQLLAHNDYNRRIYHRVYAEALAGRGVALSLTECYRKTDYGEPIVALKSYILSPFSTPDRVEGIVEHVLAARDEVEQQGAASKS